MSIYSPNRSGSMSTSNVQCESVYGAHEIGRIMYESQVNEMALFEAMVVSDLMEAQGLQEGTLLLSEAKAANKKSLKDIIAFLKEKLMKFWAKIKSAFETAIRKISAYLLGDNKAFVKDFKIKYDKKKKEGNVLAEAIKVTIYDMESVRDSMPSKDDILAYIDHNKASDNVNSADVVNGALSEALGEEVESSSDYKEKAIKKFGTEVGARTRADIDVLLGILSSSKETIDNLKKIEKNIQNGINQTVDHLKKAERVLEKNTEGDESSKHGEIVKNLTTLVGAYEQVISTISATAIGMVKSNVKNSRKALGEVLRNMEKMSSAEYKSKVLGEAAAMVDADEVEEALDSPVMPEVDAETQEAIDNVADLESDGSFEVE